MSEVVVRLGSTQRLPERHRKNEQEGFSYALRIRKAAAGLEGPDELKAPPGGRTASGAATGSSGHRKRGLVGSLAFNVQAGATRPDLR